MFVHIFVGSDKVHTESAIAALPPLSVAGGSIAFTEDLLMNEHTQKYTKLGIKLKYIRSAFCLIEHCKVQYVVDTNSFCTRNLWAGLSPTPRLGVAPPNPEAGHCHFIVIQYFEIYSQFVAPLLLLGHRFSSYEIRYRKRWPLGLPAVGSIRTTKTFLINICLI